MLRDDIGVHGEIGGVHVRHCIVATVAMPPFDGQNERFLMGLTY